MPYILYTPATRTDPADSELHITNEEVEEALVDSLKADGMTPSLVTLVDDYTEEDIEVDPTDYLDPSEIEALELKHLES